MKILTSFEELPDTPMAFTIGTFDGVHLGHQAILSQLRSYGVPTCVLTFPDHPLKILRKEAAPLAITPLPVKLLLLKTDFCLLLEFTKELASMTYEELLDRLPVSHLVLGKGDCFGCRREGTEENVRAWAKANKISVDYIEKLPGISSTEIRAAIQAGDLALAEKLLGRPHLLPTTSESFSVTSDIKPTIFSFNKESHV